MNTLTHASLLALSCASLIHVSFAAPGGVKKAITPPAGSGTTYGRTLRGDFDGDGNPDALYERGGVYDILIGPGLYDARMQAVASPVDCDVLRRDDGDRWITLEPAGLKERRMQHSTQGNTWFWTTDAVGGSGWAGASRVRVWSDDGLDHFVVGLNSDASEILVDTCVVDPEDGSSTWGTLSSVAISQTEAVVGIELFDRNGDGTPELAVRRAARLDIYSITSGTRVAFHSEGSGWTAACSAPVKHAGVAQEWLALFSNSTTDGLQRFVTVGLEGARNTQFVTDANVYGMIAADYTDDGLDEVIFSSADHYDLTVVTNTGGTPDGTGYAGPKYEATSQSTIACPITQYVLPNHATPWAGDFDLDGDIDVGVPVLGASLLWVERSETEEEEQLAPTLLVAEINDGTADAEVGVWVHGSSKQIEFDVAIPAPAEGGWWASNRYLEITLWSQSDPEEAINSIPFDIRRIALPAQNSPTLEAPDDLNLVPGDTVQCSVPADCLDSLDGGVGFEHIVYMRVQIVKLRLGTYSAVTPGTVYALHAQEPRSTFATAVTATANGDAIEELIAEMPEGSVTFWVISPPQLIAKSHLPPPLGKRVGMGAHVPSILAPLDESPVGRTD